MSRENGVRIAFDDIDTSAEDKAWALMDAASAAITHKSTVADKSAKTSRYSLKDLYGDTNGFSRGLAYLFSGGAPKVFDDAYDLAKFGWQTVNDDDSEVVKGRKRLINRNIVQNIYSGAYSGEPAEHWKRKIEDAIQRTPGSDGRFDWGD